MRRAKVCDLTAFPSAPVSLASATAWRNPKHVDAHDAAVFGKNSYILSLVAAFFLPLEFLTGLFGINIGGLPGLETPDAFLTLSLGTAVLAVALYAVFRLSK